jgi:tRNA A37 threonylcarbamoyladenosine dehydratase
MPEMFSRTELLLGKDAIRKLNAASVAVFGLGGVGSFAAEALARSGVGRLSLFDHDRVCESNINRQLIALVSTIGMYKADVMRQRVLEINPKAGAEAFVCFYDENTAPDIDLNGFDYIVDAIDTVSSKILLIENAYRAGVPVISSMGAGNKLDATRFEVSDIYETSICPLARVMRRELKKRGIGSLKVVYSKEPALKPESEAEKRASGRPVPGSVAFVPSVAGLILAGQVVLDIIKE